ncbi:MAG: hypothetical protein OP8BY_0942 [Candidatus Saccharicenans subterraneus]|uniref:Uncharacterized protein n=1 Tax=Candidatus Saccharicenans subterraneus TaxID=2508984 RepID=A0A3E2BQE5_9BACT|nr:MAG: hypothetical protein OP8BY_0942 [Candidatus Saccharicenans subterraneum]
MAGFRIRLKNNIITSGGILRKMTRTKKPVLGLTTWLLVLLMAGSLSASTVQFTLAHNATSNIFQSYQPLSDQLTSASLYFGGDSEGLSLYGDFNLSFLYKYSGLSSFAGKLGADYLVPAGSRSAFYFALEGEGVLFRNLYDYFNHGTIRFVANFKSYLDAATIVRLDTLSQLRDYKYSIFDYFSENMSLSLDHYFPSKTTLKIEAGYGYKLYFHPGIISSTGEETPLLATQVSSTAGLGALAYRGPVLLTQAALQGGPGGHGGPGQNYEMGGSYSIRGIPYQTIYYTGSQNIQIASIGGLLAQGLGDRLGLSLGALKQWNLAGENPFASSDELFMVENPTYDQFSWEGYSLTAKLTALLSENLNGAFQYDYFSRKFPGLDSLDLEGNSLGIQREDKRHQFSARLQLDLRRVSFFLNYAYIKNNSTDPWFTWDGNVISGGLTWNLQVTPSR